MKGYFAGLLFTAALLIVALAAVHFGLGVAEVVSAAQSGDLSVRAALVAAAVMAVLSAWKLFLAYRAVRVSMHAA